MFSRLLKGAPPGQEAVNHYISELSIVKGGNHKLDTKYRKHLAMIEVKADCLASYFHFPPFSRLVRTSTTTTTSFLGKVQWTGEIHYNLPFLLEPFLFQRLPVPQPPIGEGLCQPDPPCLESTLLINHMIIVVVIMTIILLMIFMRTPTSLIYCLTVSSVFWPDIDSIIFSAASSSNTFVLAPICSKSYSIE